MSKRVAIIGLDSVPPEMMFDKLLDKLPNIKRMYEQGMHGNLETCHPPITVPAWMVMMTGKNPGKLGDLRIQAPARLCIQRWIHRKFYYCERGYRLADPLKAGQEIQLCWEYLRAIPPKPIENTETSCLASSHRDRISSSQTRRN